MSTIHMSNKFSEAQRRCKENWYFQAVYHVQQPVVNKGYNKAMSGVDKNDVTIC